jgi:protein SCO1
MPFQIAPAWKRCSLGFVLAASAACHSTPPDSDTARHPLTGIVVRFDRANAELVVAHDAIEGLMPAMTMPFGVSGSVAGVQPGDRIKAVLIVGSGVGSAVGSGGSRLEDVVVTKRASGPILTTPPVLPAPPIGAEVPDFQLRNQDDEPIRLRQFRGRAVILTFIYTRCPLPDFCPLMMKHFDGINRQLASRPDLAQRVHLLGVSVDPGYDTPAVLKAYGKAFITGRDAFERLDLATGAPGDIRAMATFFGLTYSPDAGQITHTLSTAIIGVDGRIVALLPSNSWRPSEALDAAETHLRRHLQ